MRTLRAALASTTPLRSTPRLYGLTVLTVRLPETGVRHQPKPLYVFNRFGCTASAVLRVRLPPKRLYVFAGFTHQRSAEAVQRGGFRLIRPVAPSAPATCTRECRPSLSRTWPTWVRTVPSL